MDAATALTTLGGISTAGPVVALSSRKKLTSAVARGEILRLGHNRYCLPAAEQALVYAESLAGHLTHLSAAMHHGWEICFPPARPQLIVPADRAVPDPTAAAVELHRLDLRTKDTDGWAASKLCTVLLSARDLGLGESLAVADSALRHGDLTQADVVTAAHAWRGEERDRILRVARLADGRAANPFESALRALAIDAGLSVIPQWEIRSHGLTLHPDLADPLRGIVLEADSWTHHAATTADHERDCARYNALVVAGWIVLRFTWADVMLQPARVTDTIRALLAAIAEGDIRVA